MISFNCLGTKSDLVKPVIILILLLKLQNVTCVAAFIQLVPQKYPFFVIVTIPEVSFCGGTLLTENAVLTAAHCLFNEHLNEWTDSEILDIVKSDFTRTDWRLQTEWYTCEGYKYHPYFDPYTKYASPYDLAVVKLNEEIDLSNPANGVLPVCSDSRYYNEGLFIGMGRADASRANPG